MCIRDRFGIFIYSKFYDTTGRQRSQKKKKFNSRQIERKLIQFETLINTRSDDYKIKYILEYLNIINFTFENSGSFVYVHWLSSNQTDQQHC